MNKAPFSFKLKYNQINLSEYPADARALGSERFKQHLRGILELDYSLLKGNLDLKFSDQEVFISWNPNAADLKKTAPPLLQFEEVDQEVSIIEKSNKE
ncbi:hypothetical protein EOL70_26255 [Leucothrix sargassi]|nr:hypothetical protein EOL70_26255 [Leucothrix sargassi]